MNRRQYASMNLFFAVFLIGWGNVAAAGVASETQTVSGGGVTVAVTYTNPRAGESPRFEVALNTHSVDLAGYDLKNLAALRDEANRYAPTKVENKGSGHHRQVTLIFPRVSEGAKRVELVIKDIAGVKERTYRWSLP